MARKNTDNEKPAARTRSGSFIAEYPVAIWMLFVFMFIPFLDIAALTIRYTFVVTSARDAVHAASHARSFSTNLTGSELSAINAAQEAASRTAGSFSEITVESVTTRIVITDLATRHVSYSDEPLDNPPDTTTNLYEIETVVRATVNPLITFATGILPNVPGLSQPVEVSVAAREYCENPQGLTI